MSVMFGVSFTSTGVRATSFTHSVIMQRVLGHLADGGAHAALAHAVRAAEVQLEAVGAGVFGALARCRARLRACDSTMSEAMTACFG